ncbi:pyridoxamine 5'-phosphate oxidase family protein [Candidatus Nanosynbacter sp. TM7-087]|uniref:pyridoxamine 5'-phosphate oxidase family protein n=1 Tax=Candidatus Nanosynbacter sp. TM7-087 TaxID=2902631 RepID=UPI001FB827B4|nr:pyridoxamine 5'-phosphate oxidase family protein [Candidatus Nanosynbacter sp. TM7-087]MCJ1965970.1 pyridoxamine 5'-phosphate oxidase family protein [Candidatus Nanosynbacter sp. TM7-087]
MNELAKEILDTVEVGALATVNTDRTPLVTPLHFARFGNSIIWISEPTARHSENAFRNGKAEFVVWDDKKRAVFLKTNVIELPESEKEAAMAAYKEKLADFMPRCQNPQIYVAPIGELDEKTTTGNWLHFIA